MESQTLLELVQNLVKSNEDIKDQIKTATRQSSEQQIVISNQIKALREELFENISQIRQENKALKEEVGELRDRLKKIEKDSRKYKLIVHGLEEGQDEISDLRGCLDLINQNLGVECRFADIRNSFRLGRPVAGKRRVLSLEITSYFLKKEILKNSKKLKGTSVFITPDYTQEEQEDQKLLYHHLKEARQNSEQAYIKNKTLIVGSEKRTLQDLKRQTNIALQRTQTQLTTGKGQELNSAASSNKRKAQPDTNEKNSQPPKRNLRSASVSSNDNKN